MLQEQWNKKKILVTGASSGIGLEVCSVLSTFGVQLFMVSKNEQRLAQASQILPNSSRIFPCDLTQEQDVIGMTSLFANEEIRFDGVVHCAGAHLLRPLKMTKVESMNEMYSANVLSGVILTRELSQKKLFAPQGASIVFLSSAAAIRGEPATIAYSGAKGALVSITRALAAELASQKIRVNCVAPGVVKTPLSENFLKLLKPEQVAKIEQKHPLGIGMPEDVAYPITFLLSEMSRWITGQTISIDGGLSAV